jgi:hypothetical protein
MLIDAHATGQLQFFGDYQHLADTPAFRAYLGLLWRTDRFVCAKRRSPALSRSSPTSPATPTVPLFPTAP